MAKQGSVTVKSIRDIGVLVSGETPARVRKALKLLAKSEKPAKPKTDEQKKALNFYNVAKKFFRQKGRFKKHYTRKKKPAAK